VSFFDCHEAERTRKYRVKEKADTVDDIIKGMADMIWALAWADHAEEHRCTSMSGCDIFNIMPETPECATREAYRLYGMYEALNDMSPIVMYAHTMVHMGKCKHGDIDYSLVTRYSECLVYEAMGHGVSWNDDNGHSHYPAHKRPKYFETSNVRYWADKNCEHGEFTPSDE
jgi:hypothetical protein